MDSLFRGPASENGVVNCDFSVSLCVNSAFRATVNQLLTNLAALEVFTESFSIGLNIVWAAMQPCSLSPPVSAEMHERKKERKKPVRKGKRKKERNLEGRVRKEGKKERNRPGRNEKTERKKKEGRT